MHDGDPCHRSRDVKQFLEQENVQVLNWLGNSPDLNPIKYLWNLINVKVAKKYLPALMNFSK